MEPSSDAQEKGQQNRDSSRLAEEGSQSLPSNQIVSIPVKAVVRKNPAYYRKTAFDPEKKPKDLELLESVRFNGVIKSVRVRQLPSEPGKPQTYQLISGSRRLEAAVMAGIAEIPANIDRSSQASLPLTITENTGELEISHFEKMREIIRLREKYPDLSDLDVARILGISKPEVNNLTLAWNNSPPILKTLLHSHTTEVKAVLILQQMFTGLSIEDQKGLGRILVAGFSREQAWEIRNLVKAGLPPILAATWALHKDGLGVDLSPEAVSDVPEEQPKQEMSLEDFKQHLQTLTGISSGEVDQVLEQSSLLKVDWETLTVACVGISQGMEHQKAVEISKRVLKARGNKTAVALIRKRLKLFPAARAIIIQAPERDQEFLRQFFGLPPL